MSALDESALVKLLREIGVIDFMPDLSGVKVHGEGPIRLLARLEKIDELDAIKRVAATLDIPHYNLDDPAVKARVSVRELAPRLNPEFCWKHRIAPLWQEGKIVTVAAADPLDFEALKFVEFSLNATASVAIVEELKILRLLGEHFPACKSKYDEFNDVATSDYIEYVGSAEEEPVERAKIETPPIVRLCNKILADGISLDASDIHLEPTQLGVDVRFRIDGVMQGMFEIPKRLQSHTTSRFKLLAGMDIAEKRRPQDGRIRVRVKDSTIDIRASSLPTAYGEKMVLRILKSEARKLNFEVLGLPPAIQRQIERVLESRGKLLLVTGPTGSGKTTTLYTCLNHLRNGAVNIQTVEDPIEYRIPGINQVQVNTALEITFASALKSILRQDPDVIMVGEIRDAETADIALQAAQTGHLVLSTLHTNSATAVVTRLLNLQVEPYILASSLAGVLAQRLVRKLCPDCKAAASPELIERHSDLLNAYAIPPESLLQPTGCESCAFTGYRGRTGIYSYFEVTEPISEMILNSASQLRLVAEAKRNGFTELDTAAREALMSGATSIEEARPYLTRTQCGDECEQQPAGRGEPAALAEPPAKIAAVPGEPAAPVTVAPLQPQPPPSAQPPQAQPGQSCPLLKRPKVLIVEDNKDIRTMLGIRLSSEMYEVLEADNGIEGLKKVYEHAPQIVLCDLMMPVMDGKQFLARIKQNAQTRTIPVIILTAVDTDDNETELLDLGAADFVSKADSANVMLSRIRKALATS